MRVTRGRLDGLRLTPQWSSQRITLLWQSNLQCGVKTKPLRVSFSLPQEQSMTCTYLKTRRPTGTSMRLPEVEDSKCYLLIASTNALLKWSGDGTIEWADSVGVQACAKHLTPHNQEHWRYGLSANV